MGIQGVRRVDIDAERGVAIVFGTIDPLTLLMMLENYGVKAEIFGRRRRPASISSPLRDPDIAALLKSLPTNSAGLKAIEVTKTVRIDFRFRENGGCGYGNKNSEITTDYRGGGLCGASSSCCGGHRAPANNIHYCGCPRRDEKFSCVNSGGYFLAVSWPQPGYLGFSPLGAPPWVSAEVGNGLYTD